MKLKKSYTKKITHKFTTCVVFVRSEKAETEMNGRKSLTNKQLSCSFCSSYSSSTSTSPSLDMQTCVIWLCKYLSQQVGQTLPNHMLLTPHLKGEGSKAFGAKQSSLPDFTVSGIHLLLLRMKPTHTHIQRQYTKVIM